MAKNWSLTRFYRVKNTQEGSAAGTAAMAVPNFVFEGIIFICSSPPAMNHRHDPGQSPGAQALWRKIIGLVWLGRQRQPAQTQRHRYSGSIRSGHLGKLHWPEVLLARSDRARSRSGDAQGDQACHAAFYRERLVVCRFVSLICTFRIFYKLAMTFSVLRAR